MKRIIVLFILSLALGVPFVLSACSANSKLITVYSVSFYNDSVSVAVGDTIKLDYKVFPANATNKEVEFTSLDPSTASVTDKGEVTLIKNQSVDIVVRTKDGGFKSTCTIVPLVEPQTISVLPEQVEEKYDAQTNTAKQTIVLSVGQTKMIPFVFEPANASADIISVTADSSNVEIVHGASWMVVGKKTGYANITAKYKSETFTIPVWVEPQINSIEVQLADLLSETSSNVAITKSGNKFVGDIYIDLRGNDRLTLKFLDNKSTLSNQLKINTLITDQDVFEIKVRDSFEDYVAMFDEEDVNYGSFNFIKYIDLKPTADGESKLIILCDCKNSIGPIQIELNVIVSDSVGKIEPKINTENKAGETSVVFVGDSFGISVEKFVRTQGSIYSPIKANRLTYFSLDNGETAIRPVNATGESVYYENGIFTAIDVKQNVRIWVYVAKTANTPEIYGLNQSEIELNYVKESVSFNIENKIESIWLEYDGEYLLDGGTIALRATADQEIEINVDENSILIGIMTPSGEYVSANDCTWDFEIDVSNDVVQLQTNKIVLKKDGTAQISINLFDGVNLYTKTFNIVVVI